MTILAGVLFWVDRTWVQMLLLLIAAGVTVHILRTRTYSPNHELEPAEELPALD